MIEPSLDYGFVYECDGKRYSFVVNAASEESAKRRVAAMAQAEFAGKLRYAEGPKAASLENA
jgi:hypothetical protein